MKHGELYHALAGKLMIRDATPSQAPQPDPVACPGIVRQTTAKSIFSPTSGFLCDAGFTHSLSPARNCLYGCTYCYVPTMGFYGGLQREDWERWGQFTTIKTNAAELIARSRRQLAAVYCSPLVDPYQPAECDRALMPEIYRALLERPPRIFTLQTRGILVLRDLPLLRQLAQRTRLRVSFSITTDREEIRRYYEPRCEPIADRLAAIRALREAGLTVFATLAPILPCDPERLVEEAITASKADLIADPLHIRATKPAGATTRAAAERVACRRGHQRWLEPEFQSSLLDTMKRAAERFGFRLGTGLEGFQWLAQP